MEQSSCDWAHLPFLIWSQGFQSLQAFFLSTDINQTYLVDLSGSVGFYVSMPGYGATCETSPMFLQILGPWAVFGLPGHSI